MPYIFMMTFTGGVVYKRGLLVPGDCLPSELWLEFAKCLNQEGQFCHMSMVSNLRLSYKNIIMNDTLETNLPPLASESDQRSTVSQDSLPVEISTESQV